MKAPVFLKQGDKVAVIATAKVFPPEKIKKGIDYLKEQGFEVAPGKNLFKKHNHFAGTDRERAEDLQHVLDDTEIKAVFCARGGYGTSRILDSVDFAGYKRCPKWIIGFSDVTILHLHLQKAGFQSVHGPMPIQYSDKEYEYSTRVMLRFLMGDQLVYNNIPTHQLNAPGETEAEIAGGNLSLLVHSIGTDSEINTDDKILFLEETGEYLYQIDRMLVQLKRAGKLKKIKGLIAGQFSGTKDNKDLPFGHSVEELILEHISGLNIPVCFGFPSGHIPPNLPLVFGREAFFHSSSEGVSLYYSR